MSLPIRLRLLPKHQTLCYRNSFRKVFFFLCRNFFECNDGRHYVMLINFVKNNFFEPILQFFFSN